MLSLLLSFSLSLLLSFSLSLSASALTGIERAGQQQRRAIGSRRAGQRRGSEGERGGARAPAMGLPVGAAFLLRTPLAAASFTAWHHRIPLPLSLPRLFLASPGASSSAIIALPLRSCSCSLPARFSSVFSRDRGGGVAVSAMDAAGVDGAPASHGNCSAPLSPASAIQFLTLIQRLKVCAEFSQCVFFNCA
jgi:hypothetical protein